MYQLVVFAIIYGIMMFIWSFVYLNKSRDQVNQAFLWFLSVILLWMVLSVSNEYSNGSLFGLLLKTVYWLSMMNMSVFFLFFIYRLIKRPLDILFYMMVALNTLTIVSRYFYPIDYTDPTFWRLETPIVAPLMSTVFSIPAIVALYLVARQSLIAQEPRERTQLRYFLIGIGLALLVSVVSEYLLPTVFHVNTQLYLMHVAILIFVIFTFASIMKYRFLNIQSDYIFRKLFLNSSDGIIILNRNQRIISINNMAREVLRDRELDSGDRITDYIADYNFATNYKQHEVCVPNRDEDVYLSVTQYPIDTAAPDSVKLLMITDITKRKMSQKRKKEKLMEQSSIDTLTGLFNKQYFTDRFCDAKYSRDGSPLSMLFIDVDRFKAINDQYGHIAGDSVLKALAQSLRSVLRQNTDVIRFGGDEFIVILEDTDAADAYAVAERIRLGAHDIDLSGIAPGLSLTVSIGLIEGTKPAQEMLMKADLAMYRSKSRGRDRTTIFREDEGSDVFHMKV
jgi:diguanylate cyclase (GGDEF)-like protein